MKNVKKFIDNTKKLPVKTKRLLGLGIVIALTVALPLFVWAVLTQRLDLRKRASTSEPPVVAPIDWYIPQNNIRVQADNFYYDSHGKIYYNTPNTTVTPGPIPEGNPFDSNFEVVSDLYDGTLRMKVYFKRGPYTWWVDRVEVYDPDTVSDMSNGWVTLTGPFPSTPLGAQMNLWGDFNLPITGNNNEFVGRAYFTNLRVEAFMGTVASPSPTPRSTYFPTSYPTSYPTALGSPVATSLEPSHRSFDIRLKLAGVNDNSAEGAIVVLGFLSRAFPSYHTLVSTPITLHYLSNGVYQALTSIRSEFLPQASDYAIYVKGEKHLNRKFCHDIGQTQYCPGSQEGSINIYPSAEPIVLDFTGLSLEPGDLYKQDQKADVSDFQKVKNVMNKSCSAQTPEDLYTADLNYDGCVNVVDAFLMRKTLETRYDE